MASPQNWEEAVKRWELSLEIAQSRLNDAALNYAAVKASLEECRYELKQAKEHPERS